MVVVAVAGGTGNVGRAIVDALVATGKHEVKILSRKVDARLAQEIGVPILAVNYADVDAVAKLLEDNNVHTVVSGIAMHSESTNGTVPLEVELIRAADKSKTTRRIVSSGWGNHVDEEIAARIPSTVHKLNAMKELQNSKDLEYTVFNNGYFMDYWGLPVVKSYLATANLQLWLDIENNKAALPGSGNTPAVFTHTTDVARFVAASLDLPSWEPEFYVRGDRLTWNEFLRLAEDAKGTKFEVVYDSVDKLKTGQATELPAQIRMYSFFPKEAMQHLASTFGLWFEEGLFDMKPARFLNEQFQDIKPMKIKEMLDKAWKKQ